MKKKVIKKKIKKLKIAKKKLEKKLAKKVSKKKLKNKKPKTKKLAKKNKSKSSAKKTVKKSAKKENKSKSSFSKDVQDLSAQVVSKAEEIGGKIADDLKKIKGIGPVFEKRLIDLGIKTFDDLANLSQEIIEDVAEKIKAKPERIVKEHWKEQAEELLKDDKKED